MDTTTLDIQITIPGFDFTKHRIIDYRQVNLGESYINLPNELSVWEPIINSQCLYFIVEAIEAPEESILIWHNAERIAELDPDYIYDILLRRSTYQFGVHGQVLIDHILTCGSVRDNILIFAGQTFTILEKKKRVEN